MEELNYGSLKMLCPRLDSSPNPVPSPGHYCFVLLCIPKPVPHAGQGLDDVAVAWYVNVFTYEYVTLLRDTF